MQEMIADVLTIILTNTPERTGDLKRSFQIDKIGRASCRERV